MLAEKCRKKLRRCDLLLVIDSEECGTHRIKRVLDQVAAEANQKRHCLLLFVLLRLSRQHALDADTKVCVSGE
jgi:hypothetical protein